MRVLCLVDGPVHPPDRWMWNHLPQEAQGDEVDFLWASPKDRFQKWGKLVSYYPRYLILGRNAVVQAKRQRYDLVVAWESKLGFPVAMIRKLARVTDPPLLILAFSFKGVATHFSLFSKWSMEAVSHLTVLSPEEPGYYARVLGIPQRKISFCPLGWHDICKGIQVDNELCSYIFASGRSYRDYQTFLQAMEGLHMQSVINTRRFALRGAVIPSNVTVNEYMPEKEYAELLYRAKFVVVPLQYTLHAAGEGTVIQAMAAGKALVATRTPSTSYYVVDGVTGILVSPYDHVAMREACEYLIKHPSECVHMGMEARRRYENLFTSEHAAQCQHAVMKQLVHQSV